MNTAENVQDALRLLPKLIERTRQKKLTWGRVERDDPFSQGESFLARLDNRVNVTVAHSNRRVIFLMEEPQPVPLRFLTLLHVELEDNPQYGYDHAGEEDLYKQIAQLMELARRAAGDIDRKVDDLDRFLDSL
jgi:hypothetical protein